MTELEQRLYNEVSNQSTEFIDMIKGQKSEYRYIQIPIFIDGVFDTIKKDTKTNTYTLEYKYTKNGQDVETRYLDVTKIFTK